MLARRDFVRSLFSATAGGIALPSLRNDGIQRILAAGAGVAGRSPESLAGNEEFWREIQQAFTVDRSIINLNNGGVSPPPRIVQEAMRRYLPYSNEAPTYTLWRNLEPPVARVSRGRAPGLRWRPHALAVNRY